MADDGDGNAKSHDSTPEPGPRRKPRIAIPLESTSKFPFGADAELIEYVRSRPVLYDPSHSHYMDNQLKNTLWIKIGKQLKANPSSCKARWNNIRDQYRKTLRKRIVNSKLRYKFAHLMGFMDPIYKGQFDPSPSKADNISSKTENSDDSNDTQDFDETHTKSPNHDAEDPEETQTKSVHHDGQSEADILSNQSESVVEYEMFERSNVSGSLPPHPTPQAVDEFFAAIGPTLKALNPLHLSMAKAEIFAVVHKYELKGIMQNGWAETNVNPLP